MLVRICSLLLVLVAMPAFGQVDPSAVGGVTAPDDNSQMVMPPLVSGVAFPNVAGSDVRSNYLAAGLNVNAGYIDNILPAETSTPVSDGTFLINPTISFDRAAPRQHTAFVYTPVFSFYEPDSVLDSIDQNATFRFEERLSPGAAFNVTDSFLRTSDVFNEAFPFSSGIGGSTEPPVPAVLAPFAEQTANNAGAALSYQFGASSMVGAGGSYSLYNFDNPNQAQGLYNSTGESASGFYAGRFGRNQYVGLDYQYARTVSTASTVQVNTQMETLLPFYSIYFNRNFSLSAAAGAQNTSVTEPSQPASGSWFPEAVFSLGWQRPHTNLAFSYLHVITAGSGLVGAYKSNSVNATGAWKINRDWNAGASMGYNTIDSALTVSGLNYQGGNSFFAGATLAHPLGEHFNSTFGYDRLHETYSGIAVIDASPNTDRVYVTLTYQFSKPVGR